MVAKFHANFETGHIWQTGGFSYHHSSNVAWGAPGMVITAPGHDQAEVIIDGRWSSQRVFTTNHNDAVDISGISYGGQQSGYHSVYLHGGNDYARVYGGGEGGAKSNVWGGDGNDYLIGRNASLVGENGHDTLVSRNGAMTGGSGSDTFVAVTGSGYVTVNDYTHGVDLLAVQGISPGSLTISKNNLGTWIGHGNEQLFRLAWYQGPLNVSQIHSQYHSVAANV